MPQPSEYRVGRRRLLVEIGAGAAALAFGAACVPNETTREGLKTTAQAVFREQLELVRDPQLPALAEISKDREYMFSQVGRALVAAYGNGQDGQGVVAALRDRETNPSLQNTIWDSIMGYFYAGNYSRFALVERVLADGEKGIDFVAIPNYFRSPREKQPANVIPHETLINMAAARGYDLTTKLHKSFGITTDNWDNFARSITMFSKGFEPAEPLPTAEMQTAQRELQEILVPQRSGRGPKIDFVAWSGKDPEFVLDIKGAEDVVRGLLKDAEKIAEANKLHTEPTKQNPRAKPYLTRECIRRASYGDSKTPLDPTNKAPKNPKPTDFIRIAIGGNADYFLYVTPPPSN